MLPIRSCVLAASQDGLRVQTLTALQAAGYNVVEIWTAKSDLAPGSLGTSLIPPKLFRLGNSRLKHVGVRHRTIDRPWLASLMDALDKAPPFDVLIAAGTHIIFPQAFLDRLPGKVVNLHPALLPHYRGPLPFHALLVDGAADLYGGMTLHLVNGGIDCGAIIGQRPVRLGDHKGPAAWMEAVTATIGPLIAEDLDAYLRGQIQPRPQAPGAVGSHTLKSMPLHVGPGQSVERITRFMAASPHIQRNCHAVLPRGKGTVRHVVDGAPIVLGPPSGAAPEIGFRHLTFDATDARVRLRRVNWFERHYRKLRAAMKRIRRRLTTRVQVVESQVVCPLKSGPP